MLVFLRPFTERGLVCLTADGDGGIDANGESLYDPLQASAENRLADILRGLAEDRAATTVKASS